MAKRPDSPTPAGRDAVAPQVAEPAPATGAARRPGLSLKGQALRLLAQREHSRQELERKLRQKAREAARRAAAAASASADGGDDVAAQAAAEAAEVSAVALDQQIQSALDDLGARGFQSDARTAASVLHSQGARFGSRRLQQTLQAKGLAPDLVRETLAAARETELARAQAVWSKRFGAPAADAAGRAKQMRFLAGRGFGGDVIRRVVAGAGEGLDEPGWGADD